MKKRALRKDFIIEIKKTYNRFLSILLIVALGVAFFSGLRACRSDMELTADDYYDDLNLMDLRVISTLGLTKEDVEAISALEGVKEVEPAYALDVLTNIDGNELVLKTYSLNERVNQIYLVEGRAPESADECIVDTAFLESTGLKIGDTIKLESGDETELSENFITDTFVITGSCKDGRYLTYNRGNSTIGSGKINSFIMLPKESFTSEIYHEIYVTAENAKEQRAYSDAYEDIISDVSDQIKGIAETQEQKRYEDIIREPMQELEDGEKELSTAKEELREKKQEAVDQFDAAEEEIEKYEVIIEKARETLEQKKAQLYAVGYGENDVNQLFTAQEEELKVQEESVKLQRETFENKKKEAFVEISDAEEEIAASEKDLQTAREELEKIEQPEWYVLDRNTMESYVSYGSDAERMEAIAEVFPAFFFLVAALVCLTTMTRMVDEQRVQIGTLKALGYSKRSIAMKYIIYALLATVSGSIIGVLIGQKIFPYIVITAYKILYVNLPYLIYPYQVSYAIIAGVLAVLCTTLATYFACYKELSATPAALMRPVAPKPGKRILLERVPFIWNRLNFTKKSTLRNLFRYKKRLLMTVIGIAGCMALLLVGFGLKDSIGVMADIQYTELWKQDATVSLKNDLTRKEQHAFLEKLTNNEKINQAVLGYEGTFDVTNGNLTKSVNLIVLEKNEDYKDYYSFRNRLTKEKYEMTEDGVILSEKLASMLSVAAGDTISIQVDDFHKEDITVSAVTENYIYHMVYMSSSLYEKVFEKEVEYNQVLVKNQSTDPMFEEKLFSELLEDNGEILSISSTSILQKRIDDMLSSLNVIVYVLIICAGLLAFIVLYNLSNINITERKRELASLKVLGFYNNEVNSYVMKENMFLTVFGILFGIGLGIILHRFVIITSEIELVMFGRLIKGMSYIYSSLLTFGFSLIVSFVMYFKLKKINMIESLKSVE